MWIDEALSKINYDLKRLELHKEAMASLVQNQRSIDVVNPHEYKELRESKIWSRTNKERKAFEDFNNKMKKYTPISNIQKKVLGFTKTSIQNYWSFNVNTEKEQLERYINASVYWDKKTVTVTAQDKKKLKIVYASNDTMQCVIFEYLGIMVISTMSSFENYLRDIEGKDIIVPLKKRTVKARWKTKLYKALEPPEEDTTMIANKLGEEWHE